MLKKIVAFAIILGFLIVLVPEAFAEHHNPATKLGRGIANAATGWVEIPKQVYLTSSEYDPLTGLVFGSVKGVCYAVLRTASGAYDGGTFLVPPYDKPLLEPKFVFEGWK